MNLPQKCFKTTEKPSLAGIWLTLWRKTIFVNILSPFTGLLKNNCLNKSKFSSGFAPFKHGKKNKLSEYLSARF